MKRKVINLRSREILLNNSVESYQQAIGADILVTFG